jgi:hypothetical protein
MIEFLIGLLIGELFVMAWRLGDIRDELKAIRRQGNRR